MSVEALTADGFKLAIANASGPAAATVVDGGSSANIDLTISPNPANIVGVLGIRSISGLPSGIALVGISYPSPGTVRITVYNVTTSDITVSAGSVSATLICKAS